MVKCPKCENSVTTLDKFCKSCGTRLKKEIRVAEKGFFRVYKKYLVPAVVVFVVLIIVIVVLVSQKREIPIVEQIQEAVKPAECGNQKCERGEDSSSCCLDCGCPEGYSCDANTCKKLAQCGNGVCEEGESSANCCRDCGCPSGETCQNNVCIELKPEIETSFLTNKPNSVTFLRTNGNNLGVVSFSNSGNDIALNTKVIISSQNGYFGDKTINVGTVSQTQSITKAIGLNFYDSILDITSDQTIQLNAQIIYYNSANKKYESTDSYTFGVKGRNYFDWNKPDIISSWVTPNQDIIREFASRATGGLATYSSTIQQMMAARWIFESMRAYGVAYTTDAHVSGDYIQFPIETLRNKGGDCEDNAILFASLIEAIGLKSVIILIPNHAFSGFINKEGYLVPIETTASNFDSALEAGLSGYQNNQNKELIYPSEQWTNYPQVILPEKTTLEMPYINKQIGECQLSLTLAQGWIAKMPVLFTNTGGAPGAGCAAMNVYNSNKQKIDDDLSCWRINPGETKQFDYVVDITFSDALSGYSCSGY